MNTALGMMTRNFVSPETILLFLENAKKYQHEISSVIVVTSGEVSGKAVNVIESSYGIPVTIVRINEADRARIAFAKAGISEETTEKLLHCETVSHSGLVPYGFNRNNVLIEAILQKMDVLVYIDDDVAPYVLKRIDGKIVKEEVDFFGRHLGEIEKGADITTSDYSGYNILPYAYFDGMQQLLVALQKDTMLEFWRHARMHECLYLQHNKEIIPVRTKKVIGGNMAIDLRNRMKVLPFFSPYYEMEGTTFLARGEDTLIANIGESRNLNCVDVDMYIFHNTYGDYPEVPSLKDKKATQERFFYACTGWIGRNPFMNYMLGNTQEVTRKRQQSNLLIGVKALIDYTGNDIYSILPKAHDAAWNSLPKAVVDYRQTMDAWDEFINLI